MFDINNYFNTSSNLIKSLSKHENEINIIVSKILENHKNGNKILVAGNGQQMMQNILLVSYNVHIKIVKRSYIGYINWSMTASLQLGQMILVLILILKDK